MMASTSRGKHLVKLATAVLCKPDTFPNSCTGATMNDVVKNNNVHQATNEIMFDEELDNELKKFNTLIKNNDRENVSSDGAKEQSLDEKEDQNNKQTTFAPGNSNKSADKPNEEIEENENCTGDDSSTIDNNSDYDDYIPSNESNASEDDVPSENDDVNDNDILDEATGFLRKQTSSHDELKKKKARKGHANFNEWTSIKNQSKRQRGLAYNGLGKDNLGKWKYHIPRAEKKLKPPCHCSLSQKATKIKCTQFSEEDRKAIFNYFWSLNRIEKKMYVRLLIDEGKAKDTKNQKNETSRRQRSLFFHLRKNNIRIRVCKIMFLNTLGLNEWCAHNWLKKSTTNLENDLNINEVNPCQSTKKKRHLEGRQEIINFLTMLPKVESHYCRKSTSKEYLEPIWRTKTNVFREYEKYCAENNIKALKYKVFEDVFTGMNLGIFMPKKDQCDLCIGYKTKNVSAEDYEMHQRKKEEARQQKEHDKENGKFVYTMDLQSVLLCPVLKASAIYYKTKLTIHNFTIFNLKTSDGYCFLWDESEGTLSANEFTSIICHFISTEIPFKAGDEIIFYSDGCCAQNRNTTLCNGLLNLAITNNITIVQRILEKGHTQMECDSMHSTIERRLRNQDIYSPAGYVDACKHARIKPKPYHVKNLRHDFFKNYSQTCTFYKSIRPGNKTGDPVVMDIRAISHNPNGTITYKLHHSDNWELLPQRINRMATSCSIGVIPNLYQERLKIKTEKWKHLQSLKMVLEPEYHHFYDSLPHE